MCIFYTSILILSMSTKLPDDHRKSHLFIYQ